MTIKEAMSQAYLYAGITGIFYNPVSFDAVITAHNQEPEGYLLWCDCSIAVKRIELYGLDGAYDVTLNQPFQSFA